MPTSFSDLGVPAVIARALSAHGITAPFTIQSATIPDGLAGRDICGRAPTGSGKTIAFGIPLVARTAGSRPKAPAALVLAWYIAQWLTLVFVVRLVSVFKARIRARFYTRHTVRVALPVKLLISDF